MTEEGKKTLAECNVAAGLSLGEYTALAYAGAFSFEARSNRAQREPPHLRHCAARCPGTASPSRLVPPAGYCVV